jgi:uncharacterized protein (DUF1499 family)
MQKLMYIVIALIVVVIIAFFVLGYMSKKGEAPGLQAGHLEACISNDNCVLSETIDGKAATIEPLAFTGDKDQFLTKITGAIELMQGTIVTQHEDYIAATFTSGIFGFVDDVEFRLTDDNLLHFRSASRVGKKDFGANKKRIDALKQMLAN